MPDFIPPPDFSALQGGVDLFTAMPPAGFDLPPAPPDFTSQGDPGALAPHAMDPGFQLPDPGAGLPPDPGFDPAWANGDGAFPPPPFDPPMLPAADAGAPPFDPGAWSPPYASDAPWAGADFPVEQSPFEMGTLGPPVFDLPPTPDPDAASQGGFPSLPPDMDSLALLPGFDPTLLGPQGFDASAPDASVVADVVAAVKDNAAADGDKPYVDANGVAHTSSFNDQDVATWTVRMADGVDIFYTTYGSDGYTEVIANYVTTTDAGTTLHTLYKSENYAIDHQETYFNEVDVTGTPGQPQNQADVPPHRSTPETNPAPSNPVPSEVPVPTGSAGHPSGPGPVPPAPQQPGASTGPGIQPFRPGDVGSVVRALDGFVNPDPNQHPVQAGVMTNLAARGKQVVDGVIQGGQANYDFDRAVLQGRFGDALANRLNVARGMASGVVTGFGHSVKTAGNALGDLAYYGTHSGQAGAGQKLGSAAVDAILEGANIGLAVDGAAGVAKGAAAAGAGLAARRGLAGDPALLPATRAFDPATMGPPPLLGATEEGAAAAEGAGRESGAANGAGAGAAGRGATIPVAELGRIGVTTSKSSFRRMLTRIARDPNHPLHGLIDPATNNLRPSTARGITQADWLEHPEIVEAGHYSSAVHLGGAPDRLIVMSAYENRLMSAVLEHPSVGGSMIESGRVVSIGGVPVDFKTATDLVARNILTAQALAEAPTVLY
jgi:hypothetical protein